MKKEVNEKATSKLLAQAMATWFVRANNHYYTVEKPSQRRSQKDLKQMSLQRFVTHFPEVELTSPIVRDAFKLAIEGLSTDPSTSIPVWDGTIVSRPGHDDRLLPRDGEVSLNAWVKPSYRSHEASKQNSNLYLRLISAIMANPEDRKVLTDWLSWSLQNETEKPGWAIILYSRKKGTGKSTLCKLIAALFGNENAITQNNIEKITSRFNQPILENKIVIAEEIQLREGTTQGNALKTFITENEAAVERKGKDIEKIKHACCFLGTTNHFPGWIESGDRRLWVIDCDHDGHAAGPKAQEFGELVGKVHQALEDPVALATMYDVLMNMPQRKEFDPHSLHLGQPKTEMMQRIQAASGEVILQLLSESLEAKGLKAISLSDLKDLVVDELNIGVNRVRHLMTELGWSAVEAKWEGVDYRWAVWVRSGYQLNNGYVLGPDGYREKFEDQGGDFGCLTSEVEIIETYEGVCL